MLKRYSPFVVVDVPSMGEVGSAVVVSPAALDITPPWGSPPSNLQVHGVGEPLTYPSPITVKVEMREDDGGDYILRDEVATAKAGQPDTISDGPQPLHLDDLERFEPAAMSGDFQGVCMVLNDWGRYVRRDDLTGLACASEALPPGARARVQRVTGQEPTSTSHAITLMEAAIEGARDLEFERRAHEAESKLSLELWRTAAQEKEIARLTQALQQREREFHAMLLGYRMLARLMGEAG